MHFNIKPAVINNITDPYQIGTILKLNVSNSGNSATMTITHGYSTKKYH